MAQKQKTSPQDNPYHFVNAHFVDKHRAVRELAVSESTLKTWRIGRRKERVAPILREGVHWYRPMPSKTCGIRYNVALIKDRICNPETHEQAIQAFLATMPSSMAVDK